MTEGTQRLDKWLWFARFFKSRSLATRFCTDGRIRVNEVAVSKAHHGLRVGDVLTFAKGHDIRVIEVRDLGARRGPAPEARNLYDDLKPPEPRSRKEISPEGRERGSGRPTKAERRAIDRLKGQET